MAEEFLFIDNDMTLTVENVTDAISGDLMTSAVVTATVKTLAGVEVSGQTWPLTLTHVSAGDYRGNLDDKMVLNDGQQYLIEIGLNHDQSPDISPTAFFRYKRTARYRTP